MIKKLEHSNAYKEILDSQTARTITIPYHTDTGIIVSIDNIEELVDREWNEYNMKLKHIQIVLPSFNVDDLKQKIRDRIQKRMGETLLKVEYIYITPSTIKEASQTIEMLPNFVEWCVE